MGVENQAPASAVRSSASLAAVAPRELSVQEKFDAAWKQMTEGGGEFRSDFRGGGELLLAHGCYAQLSEGAASFEGNGFKMHLTPERRATLNKLLNDHAHAATPDSREAAKARALLATQESVRAGNAALPVVDKSLDSSLRAVLGDLQADRVVAVRTGAGEIERLEFRSGGSVQFDRETRILMLNGVGPEPLDLDLQAAIDPARFAEIKHLVGDRLYWAAGAQRQRAADPDFPSRVRK